MGNDEVCTKYGEMYIGSYLHRTMAIYSMKENSDDESAIAGMKYKKHKKRVTNIGLAESVSANSLNLSIGILAAVGAFSVIYYGCKAVDTYLLKSYEFTQIKDEEF